MRKRVLLISIFILSVLAPFQLARAASPSLEGTWLIDGKLKATAKIPGLLNVSASLSDLRFFGEVFFLNADQSFSEGLLKLTGTWAQNGTSFTVEADLDALLAELAQYGIQGEVMNYTYEGKVQSSGKMTGKITLNLNVAIPVGAATLTGTVTISGTFTGTKGLSLVSLSEAGGSSPGFGSLASFIAERLLSPIPW
jgi:hypothetical protein